LEFDALRQFCWHLKLDHEFKEKVSPFVSPRIAQSIGFIPFLYRFLKFYSKCKKKNVAPFIDMLNPLKCQQIYGVPMGGIGCGTIGRSYSGDFCRYQLMPGIYEHETVEANMFTVCIRRKGNTVYQQSLVTKRLKLKGLRSWNTAYCGEYASYYALYPESWTIYDLPGQNFKLICHQLSPVIPKNYKDSSLPVSVFKWTLHNENKEEADLSLMLTWQSGSASDRFELTDVSSAPVDFTSEDITSSGVIINQKLNDNKLEYCISAKHTPNATVTYCCQFYPDNEESGNKLWMDLLQDGQLDNKKFDKNSIPSKKSAKLAVAVCIKVHIKAFSSETIDIALVWNMPKFRFINGKTIHNRFYTRHFENNETTAQTIANYALKEHHNWINAIRKWQKPILDDGSLPTIYKCALFNELYFVSDGGSVWIDVKNDESLPTAIREYGRFGYLEGHEYRMFNTYDVHFYASFALLMLWPQLQISMQYDYLHSIPIEYSDMVQYLFDGKTGVNKPENCVPHDLGDPENEPWSKINAYISHDTKDWKDLNLKFILQVYRDYFYLQDKKYLEDMWPAIKNLIVTIQKQDHDGDCLIDSTGRPDQTYDAWSVTGASAYCGGLHVASLKCTTEIAELLKDQTFLDKYLPIYQEAKKSYHNKLWNGSYYNYDESNNYWKDSVMADMCCGHWYLRSSGLGYEVISFHSNNLNTNI